VLKLRRTNGPGESSGEGEIRRATIEADLVDCMVALPEEHAAALLADSFLSLARHLRV
jgi:hypothetical protein